ncbi:MAG TPA: hypothetical protein VIY08_01755 [Candidatus Nitrosocosmicus sp.]
MIQEQSTIKNLIYKCLYEENTNSKIKLFFKINSLLPKELKINTSSFITNDYINKTLYKLEEIHSFKKIPGQIKKTTSK